MDKRTIIEILDAAAVDGDPVMALAALREVGAELLARPELLRERDVFRSYKATLSVMSLGSTQVVSRLTLGAPL